MIGVDARCGKDRRAATRLGHLCRSHLPLLTGPEIGCSPRPIFRGQRGFNRRESPAPGYRVPRRQQEAPPPPPSPSPGSLDTSHSLISISHSMWDQALPQSDSGAISHIAPIAPKGKKKQVRERNRFLLLNSALLPSPTGFHEALRRQLLEPAPPLTSLK